MIHWRGFACVRRMSAFRPGPSMRQFLLSVAAAAVLFTSAAAAAAAPPAPVQPRAVVERIAGLIEQHYVDGARGKTLAAELRAEAAGGRFDRYTDPRDLALAPQPGH